MRAFALIGTLTWACAALAQTPPLLIYQKAGLDSEGKPVVSDLAVLFAEQVNENFALNPIQWSMADAQFRDLALNGELPQDQPNPTEAQLAEGARRVRAPFFVIIEVKGVRAADGVVFQLFRTGQRRAIWTRSLGSDVQVDGSGDRLQAERALSRTWALELRTGPLRPHLKVASTETPAPDPGVTLTPDPQVPPKPLESDAAQQEVQTVRAQAQALIRGKQIRDAVALLYQAVDRLPRELELRKMLIGTLGEAGMSREALEEAGRAILIWPGDFDLRVARVRGLLALGRTDEANDELNELAARQADSLDVQELRGQVALSRGLLSSAREAFMAVLAKQPRASAQAALAVTVALEGDTAEARRLMSSLPPLSEDAYLEIYRRVIFFGDKGIERLAVELREVSRLGRLQPGNANVIQRAQRAFKANEGLAGVLEVARAPESHRLSHERRVLAQKLLTQASAEILQFARSGNTDLADDATLSLGEALKRWTEAQQAFNSER